MIDINELRMVLARHGTSVLNEDEILELLDRLEAAESDALEQARLNGIGASREAALMAKLEAAEKERDTLLARIEAMEKQEPVAWCIIDEDLAMEDNLFFNTKAEAQECIDENRCFWVRFMPGPLYLAPGAQPAPSVPDGWKLVPIEPTPEMVEAASGYHSLAMAWRAAINVAPEAKP